MRATRAVVGAAAVACYGRSTVLAFAGASVLRRSATSAVCRHSGVAALSAPASQTIPVMGLRGESNRKKPKPLQVSLSEPIVLPGQRNSTAYLPSISHEEYLVRLRKTEAVAAPAKQPFWRTLWQFSRPHTLIGSALCIPAIAMFAAPPGAAIATWPFLRAALVATLPSLLINIYITGLNQITDVEIDRVNKPYLPIAAGKMSMATALSTVTLCLLGGLGMGVAGLKFAGGSRELLTTLIASAVVGTAYSLPPLRLKRFPLFAALCILSVRGSVINVGFYAHARAAAFGSATATAAAAAAPTAAASYLQTALKSAAAVLGPGLTGLLALPFRDPKCGLLALYFALFGVVIALMKDVPDVEGDRRFGIPSFSVVVGQENVFHGTRRLMSLILGATSATLLAAASRAAAFPVIAAARGAAGLAAAASAAIVRQRGKQVNPEDPKAVYKYYMLLWKVFYASYVLLPLAR